MIIGEALNRLFNGLTVDLDIEGNTITRNVQYHYGDHKELVKWVVSRKGREKYPLIWYVTAPYYDEPDGFKYVSSKLIILQSTVTDWLNTKRSIKSYDQIIEPVWQKVKGKLQTNQYIQVVGDLPKKYLIKDEPSFGVETDDIRLSQNDFTNKTSKGNKSVTLDVVDGRIIEIKFRIKTNCI
jgi:hypothetical protein